MDLDYDPGTYPASRIGGTVMARDVDVRVTHRVDAVIADVANEAKKRVVSTTNWLQQKIRKNIDKPTRALGPSRPFEFPHRNIGDLHRSIFRRVNVGRDSVVGEVGTKLEYGIEHELGVRPFITRTLYENMTELQARLQGR